MDFRTVYTDDQEKFRQHVREWLDNNLTANIKYPPEMEELTDEIYPLAVEFRRKLAEKGWLFPGWPKEYGGGGLTFNEQLILEEEMSRCILPIIYDRGGILGAALLDMGTQEQKGKFLPLIAKGEIIVWQCFTEPDAGTDLASLLLRASRDNDEFVLNGQKTYTSAHVCLPLFWCG